MPIPQLSEKAIQAFVSSNNPAVTPGGWVRAGLGGETPNQRDTQALIKYTNALST